MSHSWAHYCLFTFEKNGIFLCIFIYVNDFLISGNNIDYIAKFKSYLYSCFHMKDLGHLKYFVGIELARSLQGIYHSQRKYALEIISEIGLLGSKLVSTLLELNHNLAKASRPLCPGGPLSTSCWKVDLPVYNVNKYYSHSSRSVSVHAGSSNSALGRYSSGCSFS